MFNKAITASERKRILHCIPTMGGGGAERQLTYLSEGLVRQAWEVHVALLQSGPNLERLVDSGAHVHFLPHRSNYDPRIFLCLRRLVKGIQPHIIQTWIPQMDILGGLAATWAKVPLVMTERTGVAAYRGNWKDKIRVQMSSRAAVIVANSDTGEQYWINGKTSTIIVRNAIPFDEVRSAPLPDLQAHGLEPNHELIVFAGRYIPLKNLTNLITALDAVLRQRPRAVALLFGNGPQREELQSLQQATGLGNRLRVLDFTKELWSWLHAARLFISVSHYEGNPNTVLEAIACCCPVVVSDIPAHREFLNEDTAYFVPTSPPSLIAQGIEAALANSDLAHQKAMRAYEKIAGYTIDSVAQQYIDCYRSILR